nr:transcriptional regulator [Pseudomonas sp.]
MTTPSGNPFVFPGMGLGQNPEHLAGNPLLQSFEMMRTAWNNMGSQMLSGAIPTPPVLNIEELDKRINEMRAVESWLRLNLTMLQGSVQAMEVQRATIATLQSFASMGTGGGAAPSTQAGQQPSPLEVALGMRGAQPQADAPAGASGQTQDTGTTDRTESSSAGAQTAGAEQSTGAPAPHQAWWNMLQNQFNQLASAAAATMVPGASGSAPAAGTSEGVVSGSRAAPAKAARKSTKTAARKSAPRKS